MEQLTVRGHSKSTQGIQRHVQLEFFIKVMPYNFQELSRFSKSQKIHSNNFIKMNILRRSQNNKFYIFHLYFICIPFQLFLNNEIVKSSMEDCFYQTTNVGFNDTFYDFIKAYVDGKLPEKWHANWYVPIVSYEYFERHAFCWN